MDNLFLTLPGQRRRFIEILVVFILLIIITGLLLLYTGSAKKTHPEVSKAVKKRCPLCRTLLNPGENVHTVLYTHNQDRVAEIQGCPHCYPSNPRHQRICPVCHSQVPREGFVFARVFDRRGKMHFHLLGCPLCYTRKS